MIAHRRPACSTARLVIEDSAMREAMDLSSDHSARLQALIGDFLGAIQSGRPIERDIWVADHPDLAEGLRAFLADYDQFQNLAAPLRDVAEAAATVAHETAGFSVASGPSPEISRGDSAASLAAGARVRYFGDYEPLRTLGEGGMGIVFEARQRSLNRVVALKMIRAGRFAGEDDVRRFRNEAEAVAKLDHPHIVPVYEVGEHEGHNYFSMKRIDGTSVAANLSGYRDRPREAARLVAKVARAVHHAHQRGVLHRDLKPSNVLLDAEGEPHLTDFGLAKRLDGAGAAEATHTGAILGTPAYMAPEQAGGRRGEVTTATDVYGLGALLYALLTGQAPFRGESLADTLVQVREGSPVPIRKSNPKVPRDLETICARCLEREPRRRYASADAVAVELEHWLKGEPITARPVGALERSWMWCRRNPLVASLTTSVATLLILSTAISTNLALRASARARGERAHRVRAESAKDAASKARDETELTSARALIEPLDARGDAEDLLAPLEVEALWELTGNGSESLRHRCLEEAIRTPMTARRLCARAEPALIAAVGLDPRKREQALALLMNRLSDTGLPTTQKADIALVALQLVDRHGPVARACEEALAAAINADTPPQLLAAWKAHLSREAELLEPETTARLILHFLHKEKTAADFATLAPTLAKAASRLELATAAPLCEEALGIVSDIAARESSFEGRAAVAASIGAITKRMPRGAAAQALTEALGRPRNALDRQRLAAGLGAAIAAMAADQVAEFSPAFARALAEALCREAEFGGRRDLAAGLAKLAKSWRTPDPIAVRSIVEQLAGAVKAEKDPARGGRLAQAAASMADRLGEAECATICRAMATVLLSLANSESGFDREQEWIRGLGEVMIRVPEDVAIPAARLLAKSAAAVKIGPSNDNSYPARAFYEVVNEMNADDAAHTAPVLVAALGQERDPNIRWWLAASLGMMVTKMDPDEAARLCGPVLGDIGDAMAPGSYIKSNLIDAFNIVASRQASAVAGRSARVLADMIKNGDSSSLNQFGTALVHGLAVVAGRMEELEAQRICGEFAQNPKVLVDLSLGSPDRDTTDVAVLVRRMNSVDAERIRAEAVRGINDFVEQNPSTVIAASALVQLATLMGPLEAERLCRRANRIVGDALAFDSDDADVKLYGLAEVVRRMNPGEAARVLAGVLTREMEESMRQSLAESLADAAGRLEAGAATRVCDRTIRDLLRARSARRRNAQDRRGFDSALAELLQGVPARDANPLAAVLAGLMWSEGDIGGEPGPVRSEPGFDDARLRKALSRVLTDTSREQRDLRAVRMVIRSIGTGLGALATAVSLEAEPWPCRLSSQELVDLLKMPTCIGKARRVVLDQLGDVHGRRFANHWEFVRFSLENQRSLDLTTPPRRPDPLTLGFEEAPLR
jgi:serine/threonine protein kinase